MEQRLFDLPEQPEDTRHPGQLSYPEWLKRGDTVFHSSFRANWQEGQFAHVGSQTAASDRLIQSAQNISPRESDDPRGGRTWARRLTEPVAHMTKSDSNLNTAQSDLEIYKRPPEQAGQYASDEDVPDIVTAATHLHAGRPVGYRNAYEDVGTTSVLAPKGTLRAWHQDVMEAHGMGLDVHPHDVALAKGQFDPAIAITTKSMGNNVESYHNRYNPHGSREQQGSFFPYSTHKVDEAQKMIPGSETLFESRPDDPDVSPWGDPRPGAGAAERSKEHAASDPELQQGFGIRDFGPFHWQTSLDERQAAEHGAFAGLTHLERAHHSVMEGKRRDQKEKLRSRSEEFHQRLKGEP